MIDVIPCLITYATNNSVVHNMLKEISIATGVVFVESNDPLVTYKFKHVVNENDDYAGYVWMTAANGLLIKASIQIDKDNPPTWQKTAVLHETGHIFGLKHINNESSVMNPYVTSIASLSARDARKLKTVAIRSGCST